MHSALIAVLCALKRTDACWVDWSGDPKGTGTPLSLFVTRKE